jgi:hypothetical protein
MRRAWRNFVHDEPDSERWQTHDDDDESTPINVKIWAAQHDHVVEYSAAPPICALWDTMLSDDGLLKVPPPLEEPLWLYLLNVRLLGALVAAAPYIAIVLALCCCWRCCVPRTKQTIHKTKKA